MPRYLAFLRGINLGRRRVKMDRLRALFVELGFTEVETHIASGNVIFADRSRDAARLAARIQRHLAAHLGYEVDTFVRTRAEVAALAAAEPFGAADMAAGNTIHVGFLAAPLPGAQAGALMACSCATDAFHVKGREFFWLFRGARSSDSAIWAAPAIRALRLPSHSMRNLSTMRKLAELYPVSS